MISNKRPEEVTFRHLQQLRRAGLIASRKEGLYVFYRLAGDDVIDLLRRLSSPGEFHPKALAEPYVNVSAHTAPISQPNGCVSAMGSSPFRLTQRQDWLTQPLRSIRITGLHHYYAY